MEQSKALAEQRWAVMKEKARKKREQEETAAAIEREPKKARRQLSMVWSRVHGGDVLALKAADEAPAEDRAVVVRALVELGALSFSGCSTHELQEHAHVDLLE